MKNAREISIDIKRIFSLTVLQKGNEMLSLLFNTTTPIWEKFEPSFLGEWRKPKRPPFVNRGGEKYILVGIKTEEFQGR